MTGSPFPCTGGGNCTDRSAGRENPHAGGQFAEAAWYKDKWGTGSFFIFEYTCKHLSFL